MTTFWKTGFVQQVESFVHGAFTASTSVSDAGWKKRHEETATLEQVPASLQECSDHGTPCADPYIVGVTHVASRPYNDSGAYFCYEAVHTHDVYGSVTDTIDLGQTATTGLCDGVADYPDQVLRTHIDYLNNGANDENRRVGIFTGQQSAAGGSSWNDADKSPQVELRWDSPSVPKQVLATRVFNAQGHLAASTHYHYDDVFGRVERVVKSSLSGQYHVEQQFTYDPWYQTLPMRVIVQKDLSWKRNEDISCVYAAANTSTMITSYLYNLSTGMVTAVRTPSGFVEAVTVDPFGVPMWNWRTPPGVGHDGADTMPEMVRVGVSVTELIADTSAGLFVGVREGQFVRATWPKNGPTTWMGSSKEIYNNGRTRNHESGSLVIDEGGSNDPCANQHCLPSGDGDANSVLVTGHQTRSVGGLIDLATWSNFASEPLVSAQTSGDPAWEYDGYGRVTQASTTDNHAPQSHYYYQGSAFSTGGKTRTVSTEYQSITAETRVSKLFDQQAGESNPESSVTSVPDTRQVTYTTWGKTLRRDSFDARGRLIKREFPDALTGEITGTDYVTYAYDKFGRLTEVKDRPTGSSKTATYDEFGRLTHESHASNGTREFKYDRDGLLYEVWSCTTSACTTKRVTTITRDWAGRVILVKAPDNNQIAYTYNSGMSTGAGQVQSVERLTPDGTTFTYAYAYDYDGAILAASFKRVDGRLEPYTLGIDNEHANMWIKSDALGRVVELGLPQLGPITYDYGTSLELKTISSSADGDSDGPIVRYEEYLWGRPGKTVYGDNHIRMLRGFHESGRPRDYRLSMGHGTSYNAVSPLSAIPCDVSLSNDTSSLESACAQIDASETHWNRGKMSESPFTGSYEWGNSYDALGRLTEGGLGTGTAPFSQYTYAYDTYGNLTSVSNYTNDVFEDTSDSSDRVKYRVTKGTIDPSGLDLNWGFAATYDDYGNMTRKKYCTMPECTGSGNQVKRTDFFVFDAWDQLIEVHTIDGDASSHTDAGVKVKAKFVYDHTGRRVQAAHYEYKPNQATPEQVVVDLFVSPLSTQRYYLKPTTTAGHFHRKDNSYRVTNYIPGLWGIEAAHTHYIAAGHGDSYFRGLLGGALSRWFGSLGIGDTLRPVLAQWKRNAEVRRHVLLSSTCILLLVWIAGVLVSAQRTRQHVVLRSRATASWARRSRTTVASVLIVVLGMSQTTCNGQRSYDVSGAGVHQDALVIPEIAVDSASDPWPTAGGMFFFHRDDRGSVQYVSDKSGNIVTGRQYTPYGAAPSASAGTRGLTGSLVYPNYLTFKSGSAKLYTSQSFGGHALDESTGLYYFGQRYYDPDLRRFISSDKNWFGGPVEHPVALNTYAYAGGDPVGNVDRDGGSFEPAVLMTMTGYFFLAARFTWRYQGHGLANAAQVLVAPFMVGVVSTFLNWLADDPLIDAVVKAAMSVGQSQFFGPFDSAFRTATKYMLNIPLAFVRDIVDVVSLVDTQRAERWWHGTQTAVRVINTVVIDGGSAAWTTAAGAAVMAEYKGEDPYNAAKMGAIMGPTSWLAGRALLKFPARYGIYNILGRRFEEHFVDAKPKWEIFWESVAPSVPDESFLATWGKPWEQFSYSDDRALMIGDHFNWERAFRKTGGKVAYAGISGNIEKFTNLEFFTSGNATEIVALGAAVEVSGLIVFLTGYYLKRRRNSPIYSFGQNEVHLEQFWAEGALFQLN